MNMRLDAQIPYQAPNNEQEIKELKEALYQYEQIDSELARERAKHIQDRINTLMKR